MRGKTMDYIRIAILVMLFAVASYLFMISEHDEEVVFGETHERWCEENLDIANSC